MITIDATQGLDPAKVMRMVKQAVMPGIPDALKPQAERDMDAVIHRGERTDERECIRQIEEHLRMIDSMVKDTRAVVEKFKREHQA